jgi:hypothetical protein
MRKIYSCLCALCVGLLVAACSDDETLDITNSNTNTNPELKLVKVPVNVEAPFASEAETRSMYHDSDGYALYDFDKMVSDGTNFNVLLCLKYKNTNDTLVYTSDLTSKLTKTSSGAYTISIPNAEVYIVDGTSLADYDVCALLNTGIDSATFIKAFTSNNSTSSTNVDTVDYGSLFYTDSTHSVDGMCVPMYSSYANSDLTVDQSTGKGTITLDFYMMGSVVTAKVNGNPLAVPVKISKFSLNDCNVQTGKATYIFGQEDYKGEPAFNFTSSSDTCIFEWANSATRYLPSVLSDTNSDTTVTGDFWCFPISNHNFSTQFGLGYELVQNDTVYTADSINYEKTPTAGLDTGFVSGKCYQVSLSLPESELMITEYLHLDPTISLTTYNFSMVEIYNPTNKVKDLRNYGLVRQTDLINTSSDKPEYKTSGGTTEDINEARMQDLYITQNDAVDERYVSGDTVDNTTATYTNSL